MNDDILKLITQRFIDALSAPDMARWRSLSYMASLKADAIQKADPASEVGEAIRAIADRAWANYLAMSPQREADDYNELSGVRVGWFGRRTA